ncbi:MAG: hypothetical protein AABM43_12575 [Actinomycetota bacterium]
MESSAAQLRKSTALRVLVAVLVAAGLTTIGIVVSWGPLDVHTDVVGYPVFKDFNVFNYFTAYYLVIGFFPLAALALFLGLTRLAPRFGLAAPPQRERLRPVPSAPDEGSPLASDPPLAEESETRRRAICAGRVGFVGALLGLEAGIAADAIWACLAAGIAAYGLAAVLAAQILGQRWRPGWSLEERLGAVNSLGAVLSVAGLVVVSLNTEVLVVGDGSVDHYRWLPAWLGLPVAVALATGVTLALRRADCAARALEIERRVLLLVAAPAYLFLMLALVPGESGLIDMFHGGEQLGGARLVGDGNFPWSEVVLTHGIFQDVVYTWGREIFGNTHWGSAAGIAMIMKPLYLLSVFYLFVYLVGRNWLLLLFAALILVGTTLAPEQFRLILWPLVLLLLASDLDRPAALKSIGLAFLVVIQTILTPEAAPGIPAVAAVLVLYEWYRREPGTSLVSAFPRTLWVGVSGVAFAAAFAGYLGANGALDDYVHISTNLVHGHALSGGMPPAPSPGSISDLQFGVLALAPPIALLISFAYAVVRVRLRRGFSTEDWVMAATAIFVLLYYPKFLARMDTGHVYQPFVAALPLVLYIVYRAVAVVERAIRDRWPENLVARVTAHPVSLALVVLTAALSWGTLSERVEKAPSFYRPAVSGAPNPPRVGYTQSFDNVAYRDLKRIVDAYLGPDGRLFDFSNTPELFFYFMDRDPSTRYFHVSLAYPAELQADLIDRLKQARPKLIVFDNDSTPFIGLSNFDGMPTSVHLYDTSQWILDHYRPLLWTHGFTIYARPDQPPVSQLDLHLADKPVTRNVAFSVQPCTWGYAPNFLSGAAEPPPGATAVGARAHPAPDQIAIVGWAGDPEAKLPVREVIATVDGRIVGRAKPKLDRPDLVAFGLPKGFQRAGFQMQVPVVPGDTLRIFGVSRDGELTQIVRQGGHPAKGTIRVGGRDVRLEPNAVYGQINSTTKAQALQIQLRPGSDWTDYRWLEVDADAHGFRTGTLTLYDRQNRPSAEREISFETLDRSPRRYVVPVGSCAQWHGYRGRWLFLNFDGRQDISAVRLIRWAPPAR